MNFGLGERPRNGYGADRAHRSAHPRIPPGRLRRGGGARRTPRARAPRARRSRRALLRRTPRQRLRAPGARGPDRGQLRPADARCEPGDGQRPRPGRHRALPHLVREHGRAPGQDALRRAARRHGALAGAAAAVEGRAARRWLPALVVGRAFRLRGRRRRDRGERGHAGRRARLLPGAGPRPRARRAQRHRHRLLPPRPGPRRRGGQRDRPRPAQRGVRRPDHPPEGCRAPHRGRPPDRPGRADRAVRGRAGHPGDRGGDGEGRGRAVGGPLGRRVGARDAADDVRAAGAVGRPRCSSARRSTSRWGS